MSDDLSAADPLGQIVDAFVRAIRQRQRPSVEEFARRYPEHADDLRDMLPALVLLERAKSDDGTPGHRATAAVPPQFRQLGDYEILREIGRGGMGVVYEARQLSLRRLRQPRGKPAPTGDEAPGRPGDGTRGASAAAVARGLLSGQFRHSGPDGARQNEARQRAEANEARSDEAGQREQAEQTLYYSNIARAQLEYRALNVADAEDILDRCPDARRGWEWRYLKQLLHADLLTLPRGNQAGHTGWVYAVAYSPDGKLLASADGGNPSWESAGAGGMRPGEVILWDAAAGTPVCTLRGHKNIIKAITFSPDGRRIAAVCHDYANPVSIWSVDEAGGDPAGRQRAADRRAMAAHRDEAKACLKDEKRRAVFRFHLRWLAQAELTTAADLAARGALFARDGQSDRATADFNKATRVSPDDGAVWYDCGVGWAAAGRWERAVPYFARFAELGRGTDVQWRGITTLALYLGDREAYRRRCRKMLELFGRSAGPTFVSQLWIWGPLAGDSGVDLGLLVRQIDRCLAGNASHSGYRWMVQAKGMAEYRAGRMEQALEWLRKAESLLRGEGESEDANKVVNSFFLGMAYQRLNRPDEAKAMYQQGLRQVDKTFGGPDRYQPGKGRE